MSELTIKTNHQWRYITDGSAVPEKVMADQFSHLDEYERVDGFVCYRGYWYHTSDFMRTDSDAFKGWNGYHSDSAFSGVLIKLNDDGARVMLATYFS